MDFSDFDKEYGKLYPWEQQPGETDKAFNGFCIYRDLPKQQRSLMETAYVLAGRKVKHLPGNIKVWSQEWMWMDRVRAYDRMMDRARTSAMREARVEKAREKGYDIEMVESQYYDVHQNFGEKILKMIEGLGAQPAELKDLTSAVRTLGDNLHNLYKVNRIKEEAAPEEEDGPAITPEQLEGIFGKKEPATSTEQEKEQST